MQVERPLIIKN